MPHTPIAATAPPILSVVSLGSHRYGKDPSHYPFLAIKYLISHASLWAVVFRIVCCGTILSILILVILLATALKPQAQLINPSLPWWAWLLSLLIVLVETAICASLLMIFSQSKAQTNVFVATMSLEGKWRENEMIKQSPLKDLNLIKKAFFVRVITMPLQIIPVVGGVLYSAINATFTGWDYMDRYFDAIQLSSRHQRVEVFGEDRSDCLALFHPSTYDASNDYARFGFICSYLEGFPIIGWTLFPITNAIAAALFACDIERCGGPACLRTSSGQ
ncbi:hypothetical protein HJC23_013364 [Cyclotella cryptica]|uniref:Uncharacterized protein n=1 Tax=Cyclotella cryptica TaxID=29204 RepID=A0ABD3P6T6_9STRA|eukprot:CCRYP_016855-RA/>CCRYP_016855-RA protein AED:0.44 eAED:0.44 QI:0/-1/0/1/-1/1/1/0/275